MFACLYRSCREQTLTTDFKSNWQSFVCTKEIFFLSSDSFSTPNKFEINYINVQTEQKNKFAKIYVRAYVCRFNTGWKSSHS